MVGGTDVIGGGQAKRPENPFQDCRAKSGGALNINVPMPYRDVCRKNGRKGMIVKKGDTMFVKGW